MPSPVAFERQQVPMSQYVCVTMGCSSSIVSSSYVILHLSRVDFTRVVVRYRIDAIRRVCMRHATEVRLGGSVGKGGLNCWTDVASVQQLLNEHLPSGGKPLEIDGDAGPLTIDLIARWQRQHGMMRNPDGRVDPGGPTLRALNLSQPLRSIPRAAVHRTSPSNTARAGTPIPRPVALAAHRPAAGRSRLPTPAVPTVADREARGRTPPAAVVQAAQVSQRQWGIPASVTLAQWALESAWGSRMPPGSNNPFGIKARRGDPSVSTGTDEVINGRRIRIRAGFRAFASIADAFDHHGRLLATGRPYRNARGALPDPDAFADALTGVYATDPSYGRKLRSLMGANSFYRFNTI
jgi:peptidoglycan hydrolase-like protein with peptidoglycan-binding domain